MKTTNKVDDVLFHVGLIDSSICTNKKLNLLGLAPHRGHGLLHQGNIRNLL
jgi:hypothetical protein